MTNGQPLLQQLITYRPFGDTAAAGDPSHFFLDADVALFCVLVLTYLAASGNLLIAGLLFVEVPSLRLALLDKIQDNLKPFLLLIWPKAGL